MAILTTEDKLETVGEVVYQVNSDKPKYPNKNLWKIIAKNELRIRTSKFRRRRPIFFLALYSVLSIWAFVVAPFLFDLFMPTLAVQYSTIFKPVVAIVIESIMMMLFLVLMMYPLNNVYRESEIGFKESLLATPVKSNDIFLGEFLGKFPIYLMAVLLVTPIILGIANPIIDFTFFQYLTIYLCILGLVYFANLVGSIIASWIEHKISKNEKARELGKVFIWIFTIALVAIMYAIMFFLNELMANPELKNWLAFYPSLWFSNIILYSIDPILIESFVLNIWLNIVLAIGIPTLILYVSYKKAENFYSLEGISEKSTTIIKQKENFFYQIIRKVAGSKWGCLTVVQLKRMFRKKSNYARLAYIFGLLGFMTWFISRGGFDQEWFVLFSTILIAIGGGIGSIMLGHFAFIDSKDLIWVYKRSPRGLKSLVYSYLLAMLIINIFIAAFETTLISIFMNLDLANILIFFVEFLLFSEISMCQAMGIQCFSPAYGEKDPNMRGNVTYSMLLLQPMMFLPIGLLLLIRPENIFIMQLMMQVPVFLYVIVSSLIILYFGMKKLNKIE
ncbi:MAG: hypothetical protein EAX89_00030 [Candidatus Lokiarchaeota archaeon]|nr:hypothetical protein [Candidatus Lokiarchaeota archaeon]